MLRVTVSNSGQGPLPELDVGEARFVLGSAPEARVRLPAAVASAEHVVIDAGWWFARAEIAVDGTPHGAGDSGEVGTGIELALGAYRVRIAPAPAGTHASPPQRTESLARELMRGLLGGDSAPSLEVERGPVAGVKRSLPPPVSTIVIGRGEEAQWIILDEDLSRAHAELRRGWDGVTIRDLGSRNGTRVDGAKITEGQLLRDGQSIELGKVALRYRDPAERHLRGAGATVPGTPVAVRAAAAAAPLHPAAPPVRPSAWPFVIAAVIAGVAVVGLVWIIAA
ncbi:MAG TPA: FHA domain-containing protein [Kofleriaceae bacterium]|nr:FHA domain-containing protein [Kofleriaceae bacterium]